MSDASAVERPEAPPLMSHDHCSVYKKLRVVNHHRLVVSWNFACSTRANAQAWHNRKKVLDC